MDHLGMTMMMICLIFILVAISYAFSGHVGLAIGIAIPSLFLGYRGWMRQWPGGHGSRRLL